MESIRDRIKRYIKKLSPADQKEVTREAAKNPGFFVHFKALGEVYRKIDKICDKEPTITSIQQKKKKKKAKKAKTTTKKRNQYEWLVEKLQNKDPYFSVDLGVQLLDKIFEELQKDGV